MRVTDSHRKTHNSCCNPKFWALTSSLAQLGKQVSYPVMSDATKMAVVGEQWLNRCRKLHITW